MVLEEQVIVSGYVALAAILSALIGLERERRAKDAGLRTHMLVGVGACLFTSLSYYAFPEADTSRVASNVVTGVGFLGAGMIWKGKSGVHDLTTAAGIWVTAAIGMAVGTGAWFIAIFATVMIWIILGTISHFSVRQRQKLEKKSDKKHKSRPNP